MSEPLRINKYLAERHYCSRREADRLIASGNVFLNGKPAKLGDKVGDEDVVRVNGRDRGVRHNKIYLMINKPAGISTNKKKDDNVFDLIDSPDKFFPVGDMNMGDQGLLILTNDSFFAKRLALPKYDLDQEFVVEVNRDLRRSDIRQMQNGFRMPGEKGMTKPAKVRELDARRFAIILGETKPNLIRRMCSALEYEVETLIRTRVLTLKMVSTYPVGSWRQLTEGEIADLKKAAGITVEQTLSAKQKKAGMSEPASKKVTRNIRFN